MIQLELDLDIPEQPSKTSKNCSVDLNLWPFPSPPTEKIIRYYEDRTTSNSSILLE